MVRLLPKDLETSFSKIVCFLNTHPKYLEYLELSKKISNHKDIVSTIEEIKKVQKELVHLEYYKNNSFDKEKEYNLLLEKLDSYPLYRSYKNVQSEVNLMFQYVKNEIEFYFSDLISS